MDNQENQTTPIRPARRYLPVIDRNRQITPNYFKTVFFRDKERAIHIPLHKWIWYCILEVFFGEELLENLVTTASLSKIPNLNVSDQKEDYSKPLPLSRRIPGGIFSNLFHRHLVELLYYKYYHQYLLIIPESFVNPDEKKGVWDVTVVRFYFDKSMLYQLIAFRRVYLVEALTLNLFIDILVYSFSSSFSAALAAAFLIETTRRLMKL